MGHSLLSLHLGRTLVYSPELLFPCFPVHTVTRNSPISMDFSTTGSAKKLLSYAVSFLFYIVLRNTQSKFQVLSLEWLVKSVIQFLFEEQEAGTT